MARRRPALLDELVEEIVLRFPADDPASLVRAALVCKSWCRLISSPRFRRRFREFHRSAPMLGFLLDLRNNDDKSYIARFVPTSSSCPTHADRRGFALDARHGRVLLYTARETDHPVLPRYDFVIWNPINDQVQELPAFNWYRHSKAPWKAAVLCADTAAGTCDHLACHNEPFLVVFVGILIDFVFVHVYSSETRTWSRVITDGTVGPPNCWVSMTGPSVLAESALHFAIDGGRRILSYDISKRSLSVSNTPWNHRMGKVDIITGEDGRLGVAGVEGYKLLLWSSCAISPDNNDNNVRIWKVGRIIELDMMLSIDIGVPMTTFHVVGFAEGANTIFICGSDGIYAVALESGHVRKAHERTHFFGIVPYVSFCIPVENGRRIFRYDVSMGVMVVLTALWKNTRMGNIGPIIDKDGGL
ncbi:hypothetical protein PR202_ga28538 [Eleusine coracana subsp. coracana]|uniref:F-box domain-containing protein n=1 Tax=Eleusine coracana subsp. coracana TaxID=191504 RepID=A0AAV5DJE3_ELECO|nr:hypothetical protein PR202_ga28538 [Eleusine coracana subsp. coracana]